MANTENSGGFTESKCVALFGCKQSIWLQSENSRLWRWPPHESRHSDAQHLLRDAAIRLTGTVSEPPVQQQNRYVGTGSYFVRACSAAPPISRLVPAQLGQSHLRRPVLASIPPIQRHTAAERTGATSTKCARKTKCRTTAALACAYASR